MLLNINADARRNRYLDAFGLSVPVAGMLRTGKNIRPTSTWAR